VLDNWHFDTLSAVRLMSGHAAPMPLAVGTHLAQSIQHFLLVAIIQESSHLLDVHSNAPYSVDPTRSMVSELRNTNR